MKKLLYKGKEYFKDKRKLGLFLAIFIIILVAVIAPSFAALTPVKSVEIKSETLSYDDNTPGAWKITKSAKWIEKGRARITIDIDTKLMTDGKKSDIILVLDTSESMYGEKLNRVKEDTLYLANKLIPEGNKIALITFDTSSVIVTDFTTDIDLLTTSINNLKADGRTNYYQALINVDNILKKYTYLEDRGCIVLFLTDGYPCEDTPNQIPQYGYLKTQYPYLTINGIQYEMGDKVLGPVAEVSDNQYIASLETLNTFLLKATVNSVAYGNLEITDYINTDYFTLESSSFVEADAGKINLVDNQVVWNLNTFKSGNQYTLTIDVKLKDELIGKGGIYPTNEKLEVKSKISNTIEDVSSTKTPILADNYQVIYEANAPEGCTVMDVSDTMNASVFDVISMPDKKPTCEGYNFKGWKIITEGVTKVNDDYFIMPDANVTVRATWGKNAIAKSMEGKVYVVPKLYNVLRDEATSGGVAREYTDLHQDSFVGGGTEKIYHFYASNSAEVEAVKNKNNVIFAGYCWQMIRTTDTGGVKMIYNGEVEDGKCLDTRGNHMGYSNRQAGGDVIKLYSDYYYGTDYIYDNSTKTFSLSGNLTQATWNNTTYPNLIGKYTCRSTRSTATCSELYYVESYKDVSSAYALSLNSNSHYSQIGKAQFNMRADSLSKFGYMYNTVYLLQDIPISSGGKLVIQMDEVDSSYYNIKANDSTYPYTYDEAAKRWSSSNNVDSSKSTFEFSPSVAGEYYLSYTIGSETNYDKAVFYVDGISKGTVSGNSTSYIDLGSLTTESVIKVEYSKDGSGSTQPDKVSFSLAKPTGETTDDRWLFGSDVTYSDGTYTLINPIPLDLSVDYNKLDNNHYTCFSKNKTCAKVNYIYEATSFWRDIRYIELFNGKKVENALAEMLSADNVNVTNSTIKTAIDLWYEKNLVDYTRYLEDTVFCNNRSIASLGSWNPNGGSFRGDALEFSYSKNLLCANTTDRFSTLNVKAKLKFPVGLMTRKEMQLLNKVVTTGEEYWLITPETQENFALQNYSVNSGGSISSGDLSRAYGVRPAVSLAPGTMYGEGDGSMENPYVVDLEEK